MELSPRSPQLSPSPPPNKQKNKKTKKVHAKTYKRYSKHENRKTIIGRRNHSSENKQYTFSYCNCCLLYSRSRYIWSIKGRKTYSNLYHHTSYQIKNIFQTMAANVSFNFSGKVVLVTGEMEKYIMFFSFFSIMAVFILVVLFSSLIQWKVVFFHLHFLFLYAFF